MFGFHSSRQYPNLFLNPSFLSIHMRSFFIFPLNCFSISPFQVQCRVGGFKLKEQKMGSIISTASNHPFKYFDQGIPNGNGEFITNEQTILALLAFYKRKEYKF